MKEEIVSRWIKKAHEDLRSAEYLIEMPEPPTGVICFHCQQAVEKYLKAYLTYLDVRAPKTHDLAALFELCLEKDQDLKFLNLEGISALSFYAVSVRYPDELYMPPEEEAKEAYNIAKEVKEFILQKISPRNT